MSLKWSLVTATKNVSEMVPRLLLLIMQETTREVKSVLLPQMTTTTRAGQVAHNN